MRRLLEEILHELVALNGCYATDKDLRYFNEEDKRLENYWRIDTNILISKIDEEIKDIKNNQYRHCMDILNEMNNLNNEMRNASTLTEADQIYFDNRMALLKMEYDLALLKI